MATLQRHYSSLLRSQNLLAACLFTVFFSGNILGWLLYLHPQYAWLWWLSIKVNRLSNYANLAIDAVPVPSLLLSVALVCAAILVPLACHLRRSLMGTALCGHMALLACIAMISTVSPGVIAHDSVADLSPSFQPSSITPGAMPMVAAGAVLLVLCVLNHLMIIRSIRSR